MTDLVGRTAQAVPGESVEGFRQRARGWLAEHLPPSPADSELRHDDARVAHERALQLRLWEAGFAGICFPAEYGGRGLDVAYQRAFTEESLPYDMPFSFNVPTLGILAATLLEVGTHEQKLRHLPAILRGEERWVQFMSEPSGGSDMAGCLTRADRDGDVFVLNGSKIWTSYASTSDYALCLARTNWEVPKHNGLTMFIVKIRQPGVRVEPIRQVNGSTEFDQEYFDDVIIPASDVVGKVNDGWTVARRLLVHERTAVGGGSAYTSGRWAGHDLTNADDSIVEMIRSAGAVSDPLRRQLVAEDRVLQLVGSALVDRITQGMATGQMPASAGSITKLFSAMHEMRRSEIGLELAGAAVAAWPEGTAEMGQLLGARTLSRQRDRKSVV